MAYLAPVNRHTGNDIKLSEGEDNRLSMKEDLLFILCCQKEKGVKGLNIRYGNLR